MKYPLASEAAMRSEPSLFEPDHDEPAEDPDAWPNWMLETLCPWAKNEEQEPTHDHPTD